MLFTENPNLYYNEFGQTVYIGAFKKKGILNMPDEILAGDQIISTDYLLTVITKDFEDFNVGTLLEIDISGVLTEFEIRSKRMVDDGVMSEITMSKTWVQKEKQY